MPRSGVVAIIDDDRAVLDSYKFLLEAAGYGVAAYVSPLDFLNKGVGNAACLIVDQHMPSITGLDVVQRLRESFNSIPVLLITASLSPAILARANELRVRVMEEPAGPEDVLKFIEEHR
jgi:FixJ family two-component response regulator